MKLKESSNYTVNLYNPMDLEPSMTIKSNHICLNSPTITMGNNSHLGFSSTLIIEINLNTILSNGKTIIIEEDGIDKFDRVSYNELYYDVYFYMKEHIKNIAVLVYSSSGNPQNIYFGNKVRYYIPTHLPETTAVTIDGKKLYLHHSTYEIIPITLLREYIKDE